MRRLVPALTAAMLLTGAATATAGLTPAGCISDDRNSYPACGTTAPGLLGPIDLELSTDGNVLYTKAAGQIAIGLYARSAATGAPSFVSCRSTEQFPVPGCAAGENVIPTYGDLETSADGLFLYVAASDGDAVHWFRRGTDGSLTYAGCVSGDAFCAGNRAAGLDNADAIALSADGQNLYAAGRLGQNLTVLNRDPATGALTDGGCFQTAAAATRYPPPDGPLSCPSAADGLWFPSDVTVTPDGGSVYVTGYDAGSVAIFRRSAAAGHPLTFVGCLSARDTVPVTEGAEPPTGCTGRRVPSLASAQTIESSPDSRTVTVANANGSTTVFARDPATSALTFVGCLAGGSTTVTDCAPAGGPAGAGGLTISPDGRNAYTSGFHSDYVNVFARDTATGALTRVGCVKNTGSATDCAQSATGLRDPLAVEVSPDGAFVYVIAGNFFDSYGALAWFARTPDTPPPTPAPSAGSPVLSASGDLAVPVTCPSGVLEYCAGSVVATPAGTGARTAAARRLRIPLGVGTTRGKARISRRLPGPLQRAARSEAGLRLKLRVTRVNANGTKTMRTRTRRVRVAAP